MQERREFARVEDDAIRFRWPGSRRDEPVANLSRSGAKLFTVRSAPVGSLVELELLREGAEPLALLATVRRVERPTRSDREASLGMSVEFRDLDRAKDAVLVGWTGDHSESDSVGVQEQSPSGAAPATPTGRSDHRGKLWEDQPEIATADAETVARESEASPPTPSQPEDEEGMPSTPPPGGREPKSKEAESTEDRSTEDQAIRAADTPPDAEAAEARIQDLEARLTRAESLAAEALVQLARAERRVEQLEAREVERSETSKGSPRRYAGGDDGSSIFEDPLVAELFSRPLDQTPSRADESRADEFEERQGVDRRSTPDARDEQPAIEMIERVESERPKPRRTAARVDEDVEPPARSGGADAEVAEEQAEPVVADESAKEESPTSKGPISGAVAAFHKLAEDPLETVGFSRSELLGELARTSSAPQNEEVVEDVSEQTSSRGEPVETGAEPEWPPSESLALEVSREDVFVEVVGMDEVGEAPESDANQVEENRLADDGAARAEDTRSEAAETGDSWPDLEIEESTEEPEPSETVTASEHPPAAGREPEVVEPQEDAELSAPADEGERIEQESDTSAFEEVSVSEVSEDVAAAFDASSLGAGLEAEPFAAPVTEPESDGPESTPSEPSRPDHPAFDEQVPGASESEESTDEEIEAALSAAMVEEIRPDAREEAAEQKAASETDSEVDEDASDRSGDLTIANLPTCSEMVEAMRSGRIVRTPRFDRLEPVSRLDIEISDLLRDTERLEELEMKTRGRISPPALHRVLFVFFERGLVAVDPEG